MRRKFAAVRALRRLSRLKRVLAGAAMLLVAGASGLAAAQEVWSVQVPTPFVEADQPVTLELVYRKPAGEGPFPTLLFTHGSTGNGSDPREVRFTARYPELSAFFNDRGWMVVVLQRRGRGQSGGTYAEGWDPALGRYACDHDIATRSEQRALADMDAALAHLARDPLVDSARLLVGGQSRGGVLALMHAARHPTRYLGAINMVGGWAGQRCELMHDINTRALANAGRFARPTLWLYGQRDPFYPAGYGETLFRAFEAAGGKGSFHGFTFGPLRNDHLIMRSPSLWAEAVSRYLDQLGGRP